MNLPTSTTDRLLAVADIIEFHPERWNQTEWCEDTHGREPSVQAAVGRADEMADCGTRGCVAGWAVMLTPAGLLDLADASAWSHAGRVALGLEHDLANSLFDPCFPADAELMAELLRYIAKVPEGRRTVEAVEAILPAYLKARIHGIAFDCEDDDE